MNRVRKPWVSPEAEKANEEYRKATAKVELTQEMDRFHAVSEEIRQQNREDEISRKMHNIKTPALESPTPAEYQEMLRQMRNLPTEAELRMRLENEERIEAVRDRMLPPRKASK